MYRKLFLLMMVISFQMITYAQTKSVSEDLPPREFDQKLKSTKNAVLIDVRTQEEVQQGKIKGALNLDYRSENFKQEVTKLDKNKTYFLYCAAGMRGSKASDIMEGLGFKQVYNLEGGLGAWEDEGLPVEKK